MFDKEIKFKTWQKHYMIDSQIIIVWSCKKFSNMRELNTVTGKASIRALCNWLTDNERTGTTKQQRSIIANLQA